MFEQSLLEIAARRTWLRGWMVLASAGFQFLLVGIMVLVPLLHIEALPKVLHWVVIEPPPGPKQPEAEQKSAPHSVRQSEEVGNRVVAPSEIPERINLVEDAEPPLSHPNNAGSLAGFTVEGGTGATWAWPNLLADVVPSPPSAPKLEPARPVKVSQGVQNALAISRPSPIYPPLARQARIQGAVQLEAIISKGGTIESLRVLSGHPLLVKAALDAVKQWRYRPTLLNGEPVEVLTTIEVNFALSQ